MSPGAELARDVIVIGGGPAGLAAALSLCRQNHSVVVFDSGDYRNKYASEMHMVSTWDHVNPQDYLAASRAELAKRYPDQFTLVNREVTAMQRVSESPSAFVASDESGDRWQGRKVILATGVRDLLPLIDGFEDCWGTGIVHCLMCHGHEQRGATSVAILALDAFAAPSTVLRVARSCKQFAARIRIYTNGNTRVAAQLRPVAAQVAACDIESAPLEQVAMVRPPDGDGSNSSNGHAQEQIHVVLEGARAGDGAEGGEAEPEHTHSFAVYHAGTEQGSALVESLGIQLDDAGDIRLGAFQETSVAGVFAAGDCASAHKYVSIASATGFMAGAGAGWQLQAEVPLT